MTEIELKTYRLGSEVLSGSLTIKEFSILIKKSYRQAQRIIKNIAEKDFIGVMHGNIGSRPWNKTSEEVESLIVDFLKYKYRDYNLTHFREQVYKDEGYKFSKDQVQRIAKKHGLVKHPKRRGRKVHRPRKRLAKEGMMIQFDGSNHNWFGDQICDLIGGIDDATGRIVGAEFFYGETSLNSMSVIRQIIDEHGLPESFYMDQAGIYGKKDKEFESQISRAFEQVGIQLLIAGSSQAKGRVERLWRTYKTD